MFSNIWNPTQDEIRKWAYSSMKLPDQDWQLAVYDFKNIRLLFELVSDEECLKRSFFLDCLYVFIGDIVSGSGGTLEDAYKAIELSKEFDERSILKWADRSIELLEYPDKYDYDYWGLDNKNSRNSL